MKKNMLLFFVLTLALLLCLPGRWESASAHRESGQSVYESVFRLHVIANSDSAEDQAAKLRVRDAILAYERARMEDAETAEEARARLMEDGAGLLFAAERALAECGMDYGASLEIGTFPFPQREYGAEVYPAGEYAALRVVLGAGKGQNWWCVMFPPMCVPAADKKDEIDNVFSEKEIKLVESKPKYEPRFKVVEIYEQLKEIISEKSEQSQ